MATIVDCDTHYYESMDIWAEYLDPAYRDRAPRLVSQGDRVLAQIGEHLFPWRPDHRGIGHIYGPPETIREDLKRAKRMTMDPEARLALMDQMSVDVQIIYPTFGLMGFASVEDPDLACAYCRAYNRFCSDFASRDAKRLKPAMMVPIQHPDRVAREVRFAREELHLDVAFVNPTPPRNVPWSDPFFAAAWPVFEDHGVTFTFHEAAVAAGPQSLGVERFLGRPNLIYLCTHTMEPMIAVADLIYGGVLQRHPGLKVGLLEAHVSWIPGWLDLLDFKARSLKLSEKSLGLDMPPSGYFRRQCFAAAFPDDPGIAEALDRIGSRSVVFCSDWPHNEQVPDDFDSPVAYVRQRPELSVAQREAVLADNAHHWFPTV